MGDKRVTFGKMLLGVAELRYTRMNKYVKFKGRLGTTSNLTLVFLSTYTL